MISKYVKRPVTIEAVQWTGDNIDEISGCIITVPNADWIYGNKQIL